jgi:DNA-binding IclR family transcriptional regulator
VDLQAAERRERVADGSRSGGGRLGRGAIIPARRAAGNPIVPLGGTVRDTCRVLVDDAVAGRSGRAGGPSVLDRALLVLETCAASYRPLTLVELVQRTGLPKTTLHRMCGKLVELGMLDRLDQRYRIGTKVFALGSMNPSLRNLRAAAMPHLHELVERTGWATNLAVLAGDRALIVEEVFAGQARAMRRMIGGRLPLYATAVGKALLSGFSDEALEEVLDRRRLRRYTRTTVVRPSLLRSQLAQVRRTGIAFSYEEWALGTSGVAAPVLVGGEVIAAVAVVGDPSPKAMARQAEPVRRSAAALARTLARKPLTSPV